jgi:hypothetical protein
MPYRVTRLLLRLRFNGRKGGLESAEGEDEDAMRKGKGPESPKNVVVAEKLAHAKRRTRGSWCCLK